MRVEVDEQENVVNAVFGTTPTVHQAWANVMAKVQGIATRDKNTTQGFNFRGIDAVMNVVGPILREEGVFVVPIQSNLQDERFTTARGTIMRGVTVQVAFAVYGPQGDHFVGEVMGEAADSGDKATPKAHSVAFRTFLLQALCIPTDEPDPDSETYDRGTVEEQKPLDPNAAMAPAERKKAEEFAKNAGYDFYEVAAELLPDVEREKITNGQARGICAEILDLKKLKVKA